MDSLNKNAAANRCLRDTKPDAREGEGKEFCPGYQDVDAFVKVSGGVGV